MDIDKSFGQRLRQIRKARGYSQGSLAKAVGTTSRVISYYERESKYPPAKLLADLSHTLKIPMEELLGTKPIKQDARTVDAKFWPKWQQLPEDDKKTISKLADSLLAANNA